MKQKKILIFNRHKKLVLVACSINEAARYANVPPSNVSAACKGVLISVGNYYYRYLKENVFTGLEYVARRYDSSRIRPHHRTFAPCLQRFQDEP